MDIDKVLDAFESAVEVDLAERAQRHVFVHAGVVGWHGRAIVIPGRTGSGKTSLVESLVRAGATYYSDEFAVLDARGRVHPFARPLRMRRDGGRLERLPPDRIGGRTGRTPLPVGLIVSTRYKAGARWRPRRLTYGEAMMELVANTVPARLRPRQALTVIAHAARSADAFKGVRGEGATLASRLLRLRPSSAS